MKCTIYICPFTKISLDLSKDGLMRKDGVIFPYLNSSHEADKIPNFLKEEKMGKLSQFSLEMYKDQISLDFYRNYLGWLFDTFGEEESAVRGHIVTKLELKGGERVLVTGCGLGDDLPYILRAVGVEGEVYAQDLSSAMVLHAQNIILSHEDNNKFGKCFFSIGDAQQLPFQDNFFNAAFHFGGINLFDDMKEAIKEMDRVVKPGGKVVFGDEGIAPWLKETEYARIAICNNKLWAMDTPLSMLPEKSLNANVTWILGNCFYLIDFEVSKEGPYMNIDFVHQGRRGGSMRTRYFGQLEGVTPETKNRVIKVAAEKNTSVHEWLEKILLKATTDQ